MLQVPLSRVSYYGPDSRPVAPKKVKKEESNEFKESFQRQADPKTETRHEVRMVKRGWKGRAYNAVKTAAVSAAFMLTGKLLGPAGLLLVPSAMTATAVSRGAGERLSLPKKLLLGAGLTAVGAAAMTVGVLPAAALLAKMGVPLLAGAALTGAVVGATSDEVRTKYLVEDNAKPDVVKPKNPEKNLVLGAEMRFPGKLFEINPEKGMAKTSHELVLMPEEHLDKAKGLGGVVPEFDSLIATEPEDALQINKKLESKWLKEEEKSQVSLAAIAEFPRSLFTQDPETYEFDTPYSFMMMPKGTKESQQEMGALPVSLKSSALEPVNSPVTLNISAIPA